ncbi:hypothetical protein PIB30_022615 [Stylosanthes scabra]|uniref:Protein kinase domain-containing protein n=1 Tax=Stylosanthes scabra TaxID=79078 RepID=A0ABU6S8P1_9FABA|nr:hypothetical protein [Stylosanthes scabra]
MNMIISFLLFLLVLHQQHYFIKPVYSSSYSGVQDLAINCGSDTSSDSGGIWIGDTTSTTNSKHFSLLESSPQKNQSSIPVVTPHHDYPGSISIPYGTARISRYQFTYSFHAVTPGVKFIRLHFNPASYPNFHPSKSLFSVKSGPYTLLKDFNASRATQEQQNKTLFVEYGHCINVEPGQNLTLTFIPNTSHKNSYAFVNGIQVMSLFKYHHQCNKQKNSGFKFYEVVHNEETSLNCSSAQSPRPRKPVSGVVFYCVIAASVFISVSSVFLLCIWVRRNSRMKHKAKMELLYQETSSRKSITLASGNSCRCFSIIEIRAATINFDGIFVVGVGGFGKVYKGYIDDGTKPIAIKRFIPENGVQGVQEFKNEVEMLSQLSHPHLVSLIGYCNDEDDMIIVYDFMANGTLRDHLYGSCNTPLSWKQRLKICIGAGLGLEYLHSGEKFKIIHRDVKTSNILLDEEWVAKVSDFGLSKIGPNGISKFHVSTEVKGSLGYLDPEYSKTKRLTHKSDVYSFGVVLLEVLCGRAPLLRKVEGPKRCLVEWARSCQSEGPHAIDQMVDPFIRGKIAQECLSKFVEMALNCVVHEGNQRPSMEEVVEGLELALQLQLKAEEE